MGKSSVRGRSKGDAKEDAAEKKKARGKNEPEREKAGDGREHTHGEVEDLCVFSSPPASLGERVSVLTRGLFDEVPIDTLITFRVLWGVIMMWECYTYMRHDYNKLVGYYVIPHIHFDYWGFEWAEPMSEEHMKIFIWVLMACAFCVAIGCCYRLASVAFFVGFGWMYMLDAVLYLNHFYLIVIFLVILIFVPANRAWSVDALVFPEIRSSTMPRYVLWLLLFEQVLVYLYASVAKCNEDWLRAAPLRTWIPGRWTQLPLDSVWRALPLHTEPAVYFFAYGGIVFDAIVGPMLLFSATFYPALLQCIFFHCANKLLFSIGIFPQVMIACTTLFFEPDWPRRTLHFLGLRPYRRRPHRRRPRNTPLTYTELLIVLLLLLFVAHQVLFPLRHYAYRLRSPSNVAWDDVGHRWSWRMKLRGKHCAIGMVARDRDTNETIAIDVRSHLYGKQFRKMTPRPDLVVQFAQHMAHRLHTETSLFDELPAIHVNLTCSLNGRPWQPMIVPKHDLTQIDWRQEPYSDWVEPLWPMPKELQEQWPWRWPWTFRWLQWPWPSVLEETNEEGRLIEEYRRGTVPVHMAGTRPMRDGNGRRLHV
eukprot:TRINITY_DN7279_c0_g1_i1.p1 TRINITY_DN7279_c0_g1~~TRINITY_DN7279_c0_g1_i1.p1  ORF type:complete len:591 (-),score=208.49 TRINITY_DN7279_c0_g1_i1:49-1821(-)